MPLTADDLTDPIVLSFTRGELAALARVSRRGRRQLAAEAIRDWRRRPAITGYAQDRIDHMIARWRDELTAWEKIERTAEVYRVQPEEP
jgi:hypothetical protein